MAMLQNMSFSVYLHFQPNINFQQSFVLLNVYVSCRQKNSKSHIVVHQHEKMDKEERKVVKDKRKNLLMMVRSKYLCCRPNEVPKEGLADL